MIFKIKHLEGIRDGRITMAFRKWNKLAVSEGSQMKTALGVIVIDKITVIEEEAISSEDLENAGYENVESLRSEFARYPGNTLYKLQLRYLMEDPRLKLREEDDLNEADWETLKKKVNRLDQFSNTGTWTREVLLAIQENPNCRAADIATSLGREKEWLKLNIRKLKNLGLTISHETGYTLSRRGVAFLVNYPLSQKSGTDV